MIRAQRDGFEGVSPLKFGTPWTYFTYDPKEDVESTDYFRDCQNMLHAGDEIRVSIRKGSSWQKALFEVVLCKDKGRHDSRVIVERIGKWRHGGPEESKG
ncbi:MAG: hypothetical protein IIA72_08645 [Proteobacteria bacterium]|nr:hypothetical protein [Pseudomonadota bacterium]